MKIKDLFEASNDDPPEWASYNVMVDTGEKLEKELEDMIFTIFNNRSRAELEYDIFDTNWILEGPISSVHVYQTVKHGNQLVMGGVVRWRTTDRVLSKMAADDEEVKALYAARAEKTKKRDIEKGKEVILEMFQAFIKKCNLTTFEIKDKKLDAKTLSVADIPTKGFNFSFPILPKG